MLEVVEEEQQQLVGEVLGEAVLCSHRLRSLLEHERRVAQRRKGHPEDAVRVVVGRSSDCLQRKPGLARTSGASEREQAHVLPRKQRTHLGQLCLAAEEGGRGNGEVGAVEALERRELALPELVDALGSGEVLEPVLPQLVKPGRDERGGGRRDEHLAAVSRRCDTGALVHVLSDVALLREEWGTRVQPHAHLNGAGRKRLGHFPGSRDRTRRGREGDEEGIALRVHFDPMMGVERLPQHAPVLCQRTRVSLCAQLVQELGRALDVREEEGDGLAPRRAMPDTHLV